MPVAKRLKSIQGGKSPWTEEDKYQALFEQASDAIITVRDDGSIDAVNGAFQEMTGFLKSELSGSSVEVLVPDASRLGEAPSSRAISTDLLKNAGTYEDVAVLRKDGFVRYVDMSVRVIQSGKSLLAMALFRDVTEKKNLERELITKHTELRNAYHQLEKKNAELQAMQETLVQSGKMAALGELAAGIAHELNQPLQGIRGYAQEIQSYPGEKATLDVGLKEIISNVDKMATIISYLREFVRKSVEKHQMTDIHHSIEEAMKMLQRQFASRGIVVERDFGKDVPEIYANPLQLEQVFINLSTNARDAIEAAGRGRGKIRITTRNAGSFVEIVFKDDGCGMTNLTKTKIFNPFFTTKEVGKGMGLGLSLSYGILNKIHGSIVVDSEIGKGAEFTIRIPKDFRELA